MDLLICKNLNATSESTDNSLTKDKAYVLIIITIPPPPGGTAILPEYYGGQ
jgi:hypothetical protein